MPEGVRTLTSSLVMCRLRSKLFQDDLARPAQMSPHRRLGVVGGGGDKRRQDRLVLGIGLGIAAGHRDAAISVDPHEVLDIAVEEIGEALVARAEDDAVMNVEVARVLMEVVGAPVIAVGESL